jgi:Zn-finger nucleic acid-binding protein
MSYKFVQEGSTPSEAQVKCPVCSAQLQPTIRHKISVNLCQSGHGMWLEHDELEQLEDEVFDFGDRWKGTLVFSSAATAHQCPECTALLQRFKYRFYDLEMEFCPSRHGYWLDHDEDTRVLELMTREEGDLQRKLLAEDKWSATLRQMRSPTFFSRLRDLFHR